MTKWVFVGFGQMCYGVGVAVGAWGEPGRTVAGLFFIALGIFVMWRA